MIQLFNIKTSEQNLDQHKLIYSDFISDLREDIEDDYSNEFLSKTFQKQFSEIIFATELDSYSHLNWYWLSLVEKLIGLIQLHEDFSQDTSVEDDIFQFWEASEYMEYFLDKAKSKPIHHTSQELMPLIESQIISFFYLHISSADHFNDVPTIYHSIPEIGDGKGIYYIGDNHQHVNIPDNVDAFPTIPILSITKSSSSIEIDQENDVFLSKFSNLPEACFLDHVTIHPQCAEGFSELDNFSSTIEKAYNIIKNSNPFLFELLTFHTKVIVPINEPGIVSYSMQSLPSYSSINLFERDFLDLLDDLIHENGHHYLNSFLNIDDLIFEDDEKIYFSPWRRSLRPVRGIYHGLFTFYWALELFCSLFNNLELLETNHHQKLYKRLIEEYQLLNMALEQYSKCVNDGKIADEGVMLINEISKAIESKEPYFKQASKMLKESNLDFYNEITQELIELKEKASLYK